MNLFYTVDGACDPSRQGRLCAALPPRVCAIVKGKAAGFFRGDKPNSGQFGVVCPGGAERVIHRVWHEVDVRSTGRECVWDEHERKKCDPEHDFVMFKIDFKNAFNLASRARILALVTEHFPEIAGGPTGVMASPAARIRCCGSRSG
jgi:hypothetical protein